MTSVKSLCLFVLVSSPMVLMVACQNEAPAFKETQVIPVALTVSDTAGDDASRENQFSIEDDSTGNEADAAAETGNSRPNFYGGAVEHNDEQDASDDDQDSNHRGNADQVATVKGESPAATSNTASATTIAGDDDRSIAAACGKHFKGVAKKIQVISPEQALDSLNLSSETALAVKLSGNQQSISLTLNSAKALAGICFVLRGNQTSVQFSSSSPVHKLVYLASGNQTKGDLQFASGSVGATRIEMSGNSPSLNLQGINQSACDQALLRGNGPSIQCLP